MDNSKDIEEYMDDCTQLKNEADCEEELDE
jgi:hypothetical protein